MPESLASVSYLLSVYFIHFFQNFLSSGIAKGWVSQAEDARLHLSTATATYYLEIAHGNPCGI